jgi:alkylhydroperoxidase family enzyme
MFDPATATPPQLALAQQIMAGNLYAGADQLVGPLNAYLANPTIGAAVYNLNNSLDSARLSTAVKEVVNLSIGGLWGAEFQIATHSAAARLTGISEEAIAALAGGQPPTGLAGDELIAAQFVRELVTTHRVGNDTYHTAQAAFGREGIVDLVHMASTQLGVAMMLNALQIPAVNAAPAI